MMAVTTTRRDPINTVLDEVTSETLDADHIRRHIDEWEDRVNGIYTAIGDWLPEGWEARHGSPVMMHETLMRKFGVAAKPKPTLELFSRSGEVVKVEPQTLWIIGANGQIALRRDGHRHLIVDKARNFEPADWQAVRAERRCDREAITREWLRRVLQ